MISLDLRQAHLRILAVPIVLLLGHTSFNLIADDFFSDKSQEVNKFFALILKLLEFVEEAGQRLRPTYVKLCHSSLHFEQQGVHFLQILVCKALEEL